jgi:hypothetical protein
VIEALDGSVPRRDAQSNAPSAPGFR